MPSAILEGSYLHFPTDPTDPTGAGVDASQHVVGVADDATGVALDSAVYAKVNHNVYDWLKIASVQGVAASRWARPPAPATRFTAGPDTPAYRIVYASARVNPYVYGTSVTYTPARADVSTTCRDLLGVTQRLAVSGNGSGHALVQSSGATPVTFDAAGVLWSDIGKLCYLSAATAGVATMTPPSGANLVVRVGTVVGLFAEGGTTYGLVDLALEYASTDFTNVGFTVIRGNRATYQSPIDAVSVGATNLGSDTSGITIGVVASNYAAILGGDKCWIDRSLYSVIVGGVGNSIQYDGSAYNVICGGKNNVILGGSTGGKFIGGGEGHLLNGAYGVICGGLRNSTDDVNAFVGGGEDNFAHEEASVVCGGRRNRTHGDYCACLCGRDNYCNAPLNLGAGSVIVGGHDNITGAAGTDYSGECVVFMGGGNNNTIDRFLPPLPPTGDSTASVLVGGANGLIRTSSYSFIGGGDGCKVQPYVGQVDQHLHYASVVGGYYNWTAESYTVICGGASNGNRGIYGFVGSGQNNLITIGTGTGPLSRWAVIAGGFQNEVAGDYNSILGGERNATWNTGSWSSRWSAVVGGRYNITGGVGTTVLGGARGWPIRAGQITHAAGKFNVDVNNPADAQFSHIFLGISTTANAIAELVCMEWSTLGDPSRMWMREGVVYRIEVQACATLFGIAAASIKSASTEQVLLVRRKPGAAAVILAPAVINTSFTEDPETTNWKFLIDINGNTLRFRIDPNGDVNPMRCDCVVKFVELGFDVV